MSQPPTPKLLEVLYDVVEELVECLPRDGSDRDYAPWGFAAYVVGRLSLKHDVGGSLEDDRRARREALVGWLKASRVQSIRRATGTGIDLTKMVYEGMD